MAPRNVASASMGAAVSLLVAAWELAAGPLGEDLLPGDSLGLTGIPVGAVVGWWFAARVGRWHPLWIILGMGLTAVLVGNAMVVTGLTLLFALEDPAGIVAFPILFAYGLVYAVTVLPFTVGAAAAWWALMKLLAWTGPTSRPV